MSNVWNKLVIKVKFCALILMNINLLEARSYYCMHLSGQAVTPLGRKTDSYYSIRYVFVIYNRM